MAPDAIAKNDDAIYPEKNLLLIFGDMNECYC